MNMTIAGTLRTAGLEQAALGRCTSPAKVIPLLMVFRESNWVLRLTSSYMGISRNWIIYVKSPCHKWSGSGGSIYVMA